MHSKKNTLGFKGKKIIATIIVLPMLGISSLASADFDCTTIDKEEMREIMEKQRNSETLTDSETTILENAETCRPEGNQGGGEGNRKGTMAELSDDEKEEIKAIQEKRKNGEDLTDEEEAKIKDLGLNNNNKVVNKNNSNKSVTNKKVYTKLSTAYKTKINNATVSVMKKINSYSDTKQVTLLEGIITKIESKISKVEASSSLSDTKKELYLEVYNYLLDDIQSEVDKLNEDEDDDELDLDSLFD